METTKGISQNCGQGVPFCQGIREFMAESRKCQTLYSNCEGAYNRRVFKNEEKDLLKDYIYNTIYCNGDRDFVLPKVDSDKSKQVNDFQSKILDISNSFCLQKETHVSVVWVYYYSFADGEKQSLNYFPVFKIYKAKSREDAVFLGPNFKDHESWESYLGNESFPDAFICVPRHGRYHFDHEEHKLDLEFLTTRRAAIGCKLMSVSPSTTYSPFFQNIVRPAIARLKAFGHELMSKIKAAVVMCLDFLNKNKGALLRGVIVAILVLETFTASGPEILLSSKWVNCCRSISKYALMLLNISDGEQLVDNRFIETLPKSLSTNDNLSLTTTFSTGPEKELVRLIGAPKKNWVEIFKVVCSLFKKYATSIVYILDVCGCPPILKLVFSGFLRLLGVFANSPEEPTRENDCRSLPGTIKGTKCNSSVEAASSFHGRNKVMPSTSLEVFKPNYSAVADGDEVKVERSSVEKLMPALSDLEKDSAYNVVKKIAVPAADADFRGETTSVSDPVISHLVVEDVDDFRVTVIHHVGVSELAKYVCHVVGTDISLKYCADYFFHAIDPSGEIAAYLYFPQSFTAICLFPLSRIAVKE